MTLKTDDSIVRLSLIHLKIKKKYTQGFLQYSKPERIYFFLHRGRGGGEGGVVDEFQTYRENKVCASLCTHTRTEQAAGGGIFAAAAPGCS